MRSSLCVMFCSFPRLFDGRFIASVFYDPAMKIGTARFNALCVHFGGRVRVSASAMFVFARVCI